MKLYLLISLISVLLLSGCTTHNPSDPTPIEINSFEECAAAGYPIMESYPEQCAVTGGGTFTRALSDEECQNADIDYCFASCRVCPPCPECSSLSCRSAEFCEGMGFTEEWSESIKP